MHANQTQPQRTQVSRRPAALRPRYHIRAYGWGLPPVLHGQRTRQSARRQSRRR